MVVSMKKAYLTVYLSLSLGIILSLILALTEAARVNAIRMQIECVMDIGCNSILAEYHRQLLEQYELFYVDTSYGTASAAYANTEEHLQDYMEHNFSLQDNVLSQGKMHRSFSTPPISQLQFPFPLTDLCLTPIHP